MHVHTYLCLYTHINTNIYVYIQNYKCTLILHAFLFVHAITSLLVGFYFVGCAF